MEKILLNNDLVKMSHNFFELGGNTLIEVNELFNPIEINTTSGNKLLCENIYTIELINRLNNEKISIDFICNVKNKSHTYSNISSITKNNKCYHGVRYHKKYITLIQEIVYTLGVQFKGELIN